MKPVLLFLFVTLLYPACKTDSSFQISEIVQAYYQVYEDRTAIQELLTFYSDSLVFEDIMLGMQISGKTPLGTFFDWSNPSFKRNAEKLFVITNQIIDKQQVVSEGYFTSFSWDGNPFGPMYFTTILTFNNQGMIVRHTDWINYPSSLLDYTSRENSNEWIRQ